MAVNNLNPAAVPPTAAEIATAVAAPSSATIATAVAAAVPTLSQINTSVATNAPSPNGWVFLGGGSLASVVTSTVSFSAYKKLKVIISTTQRADSQDYPSIRLNGDTNNNYAYGRKMEGYPSYFEVPGSTSYFQFTYGAVGANQHSETIFEVDFASLTSPWKSVTWETTGHSSAVGSNANWNALGVYRGTSAITSVTVFNAGGTAFGSASINAFHVFGAN